MSTQGGGVAHDGNPCSHHNHSY